MIPAVTQPYDDVNGNLIGIRIISVSIIDEAGNVLMLDKKIQDDEFWCCELKFAIINNWI
jgi:hypothetical protein